MKKLTLTLFLVISFIGCGNSGGTNNNNNNTYMPISTTSQTSNSSYNINSIKVDISDDNNDIHMDIKDIGNWGSYYVGATSSINNFEDNPIEGVTSYKDFEVDCSKENETNDSINYYCYRTLNDNGYYYTDESGIGNYLTIYKNSPTYLYLKPFLGKKAYIIGVFNYKNNNIIYLPYKKVQIKELTNNSITD